MPRLYRSIATVLTMLLLHLPWESASLHHFSQVQRTQDLVTWSISSSLPFTGLASPKASPVSKAVRGNGTEGSSWLGWLNATSHHHCLRLLALLPWRQQGCLWASAAFIAQVSQHGLKEKTYLPPWQSSVRWKLVWSSFYQQVENKLTAYLFFTYVPENMSHFFLQN